MNLKQEVQHESLKLSWCKRWDLFDYLKPIFKKKLCKLILVIGANDVESNAAQSITKEMKALAQFIHEMTSHCHVVISEIIKRADKRNVNGNNNECHKMLKAMDCDTIRHQHITFDHLGEKGFHLNFFGSIHLAKKIIEKIRTFSP